MGIGLAARWRAVGLVLVFACGARGAVERGVENTTPEDAWLAGLAMPVLQEVADAKTDDGDPVPLRAPSDPRDAADARAQDAASALPPGVVRTAPADENANCHGWVFANGLYWVGGAAIPEILADNDYSLVSEPRPGDVAVYADTLGKVTHTGLVRTGAPVTVESKWGWRGVYLHPVAGSPYGERVSYYRTARDGHTLAGLPGATPRPSPRTAARMAPWG